MNMASTATAPPNKDESAAATGNAAPDSIDMSQIAEHLQSGDPRKTVLLQGADGKTRVFVNNDEEQLKNCYNDGRSFESLGKPDADNVDYTLNFRLHKDSANAVGSAGESLSPAVPIISYHAHVWWFWTYELLFKEDKDNALKATFILKSVGPCINPHRELPRGALGENIPRTQMAPSLKSPKVIVAGTSYPLKTLLGAPDNIYVAEHFLSLDRIRELFVDDNLFLTFTVNISIPKSYFDVLKQAGLGEVESAVTVAAPPGADETLKKVIAGEKTAGADYVLTFGDSSKNESVEYHVHRMALARSSSVLAQLFRTKYNPPGDQILVPSSEDRFIFPHLKKEDAEFFLTFFYTQRLVLPHFGAFARVGRVFCMIAERPQLMHLFKQWQKLLVEKLLDAEKAGDTSKIVSESVEALIAIYSAPYGALPVAKRVAASLLANELNLSEGKGEKLINTLKADPKYESYNLDKFLPGVVRLRLLIASVPKE